MVDTALRKAFERKYRILLSEQIKKVPGFPAFSLEVWQAGVLADLSNIERFNSGRILLQSIAYHGRILRIDPQRTSPASGCNSGTTSDDFGSQIRFTPQYLGPGSYCDGQTLLVGGYSSSSYDALFHEMVHALRYISGKNNSGIGMDKGLSFYGNKEEFIAVVMQGIFASERGTPIRASHVRKLAIDEKLKGSFNFFKSGVDTYKFIKQFCTENPGYTRAISELNLSFNPIHAYYSKPALAKDISETSPMAKSRDNSMPVALAAHQYINDEILELKNWAANQKYASYWEKYKH